eukprot:2841021-Amphidinium_carterae.1
MSYPISQRYRNLQHYYIPALPRPDVSYRVRCYAVVLDASGLTGMVDLSDLCLRVIGFSRHQNLISSHLCIKSNCVSLRPAKTKSPKLYVMSTVCHCRSPRPDPRANCSIKLSSNRNCGTSGHSILAIHDYQSNHSIKAKRPPCLAFPYAPLVAARQAIPLLQLDSLVSLAPTRATVEQNQNAAALSSNGFHKPLLKHTRKAKA